MDWTATFVEADISDPDSASACVADTVSVRGPSHFSEQCSAVPEVSLLYPRDSSPSGSAGFLRSM